MKQYSWNCSWKAYQIYLRAQGTLWFWNLSQRDGFNLGVQQKWFSKVKLRKGIWQFDVWEYAIICLPCVSPANHTPRNQAAADKVRSDTEPHLVFILLLTDTVIMSRAVLQQENQWDLAQPVGWDKHWLQTKGEVFSLEKGRYKDTDTEMGRCGWRCSVHILVLCTGAGGSQTWEAEESLFGPSFQPPANQVRKHSWAPSAAGQENRKGKCKVRTSRVLDTLLRVRLS